MNLQSPMFSRSWDCQKQYLSSLIFTVRDGLLRIAIKSGVNILEGSYTMGDKGGKKDKNKSQKQKKSKQDQKDKKKAGKQPKRTL